PSAPVTVPQFGGKISLTVTFVPCTASACSFAASEPDASSTAPSAGTTTGPLAVEATGEVRSVLGAGAGNGSRTTAKPFVTAGVSPAQAEVKSTVWLPLGFWLMPSTGRRWPLPFQVPANEVRPTCSAPAASIATDDRAGEGPCW